MKKTIALILTITILAAVLSGCSAVISSSKGSQGAQTLPAPAAGAQINTPPQGITVNYISFENVDMDTLPEATQNFLASNRNYRGFAYWKVQDDQYIAVFAGEKPTGGYDIEVKSVEDNEGITNIIVEEISPSAAATQVITYPYVIIKVKGITDNINVIDTNGNSFSLLNPGC